MIVHADDAGNHTLTGRIDCAITGREGIAARHNACDLTAVEKQRTVLLRGCPGPVDHPHMYQCEPARRQLHKRLDRTSRRGGGGQNARGHVRVYRCRRAQLQRDDRH